MGLRWFGWLIVFTVALVACGSPDESDWAEEARYWHDSLREAQLTRGGWGFAEFLAPDVVWDDSAIYAVTMEVQAREGTDAVLFASAVLGPESLAIDPVFFIDTEGLIEMSYYDWRPLGFDIRPDLQEPAHVVSLFSPIGPDGVRRLINGRAGENWQDRPPGLPQADEAEAIAASWTDIWSGDIDQVDSLYRDNARVRDTISGLNRTGHAEIAELAAEGGNWEITTVGQAAVRGLYPLARDTPSGVVLEEVLVVVAGRDGAGCEGELAVWLTLDDGLIVEETRYWPIERARRCFAKNELPTGWWVDHPITPPETVPPIVEDLSPTDPLVADGATITIYNGTPGLNRLLAWGLDRFDTAGLTRPDIEAATFTLGSEFCNDVRGLYHPTPDGAELSFCFGADLACRGEDCSSFTPASRSLVLHELAHAWLDDNLDTDTQARFSDHVQLDTWNDHTVPWIERAVEHAADTIVWGLMDKEIPMSRLGIPGPTTSHLTTGFEILTETDPLPRTEPT